MLQQNGSGTLLFEEDNSEEKELAFSYKLIQIDLLS